MSPSLIGIVKTKARKTTRPFVVLTMPESGFLRGTGEHMETRLNIILRIPGGESTAESGCDVIM